MNRKAVGQAAADTAAHRKTRKIAVENVNHPGQLRNVDAEMYAAMRSAFLMVLPKESPGLTVAEVAEQVPAHLPQALFPGGAKAGWWAKTVQLDLEAKGVVVRERGSPLRLRKA